MNPPRFVRANPAPGSTNVNRDKIEIEFDEIVNVKDGFSKVVVSPTSKSVPRVSSLGRKVSVQFNDTLLPNTTYTIDFADAIEDNNENNKLQGFTYTFSTGPDIDSLQISGMVLSADALEPQQGMLVGVYSNLSDTALATLPSSVSPRPTTGDASPYAVSPRVPTVFSPSTTSTTTTTVPTPRKRWLSTTSLFLHLRSRPLPPTLSSISSQARWTP